MTPRHGTRYHYDLGCHCDACRAAATAWRRASRDRSRAARTPGYLNELAGARARHEAYRGRCRGCGAKTTGCFGPGKAPDLCQRCAARKTGVAKRGSGPMQRKALTFIGDGERGYMEIAHALGISKNHAGVLLHYLLRYGLVERVARGRYRRPGA